MTQAPTDALRLVPVEPTEAMVADGVKAAQRAEQTGVSWPEMASFTYRAMLAAAPASPLPGGGNEALIAELKEARGLLQGFIDDEADAVTNPLGGLSLGGLMDARDNSGCVYQSAALADRIAQTRAFLARNGKGEG